MTYAERAKQIFNEEIVELQHLQESIDATFDEVVEVLYACQGNVAEAMHGDLGMLNKEDVVILVSNSGETSEILNAIDPVHRIGCTIVAMTGNLQSPLAQRSDYALSVHVDREACPLGLAPTTSTTATLMMGDALLVCLMEKRKFQPEDFSVYHPGGALGRKLMGTVKHFMTTQVPQVQVAASFRELVCEMSDKHLGMTMVYDGEVCVGIITDGDVRRAIQRYNDVLITAAQIMTPSYKVIEQDALLTDALAIMDQYNITTLAVTADKDSREIIGIISIHHIIDFK